MQHRELGVFTRDTISPIDPNQKFIRLSRNLWTVSLLYLSQDDFKSLSQCAWSVRDCMSHLDYLVLNHWQTTLSRLHSANIHYLQAQPREYTDPYSVPGRTFWSCRCAPSRHVLQELGDHSWASYEAGH